MNKTQATAAVCQIKLENGDNCKVQAIGRCATCGRTFCRTHQARQWYSYGPVLYVDMCTPCFAKTPEEVAYVEEAKRQAEVNAAEKYVTSGAARTALLTAKVLPVEIYHVYKKWKAGFFGLDGRYIDVVTLMDHGWILGKFKWQYGDQGPYEGKKIVGDWLTAIVAPLETRLPGPLVRVHPYPPGYQPLYTDYDRF